MLADRVRAVGLDRADAVEERRPSLTSSGSATAMDIELFGGLNFFIQFPLRPEGMILLGIYLFTTLTILFLLRHSIFAMRKREWLIFFGLGVLTLILSNALSLRFAAPDFQPVPNLPQDTAVPAAPLFAAVPLLLAALWLGMGPAVLLSAFSAIPPNSLSPEGFLS